MSVITTTAELLAIFRQHPRVSTDTRTIRPDSLFFALRGPHFDANVFAADALAKGAAYAVIDDPQYAQDPRCLLVEDALKALQDLARAYRQTFQVPVLGITGSNGKTTTKELVAAVLSRRYRTFATQGNLNNHIGVPLTLLSVQPDAEMIVVELGDNKIGDIAELCQICLPTHGLITNVGKDHLEGFGSMEGNIQAKSELFDFLVRQGGQPFICSRNQVVAPMAARFDKPVLYGGREDAHFTDLLDANPFIRYVDETGEVITTRLLGIYNFPNILAAIAIGAHFGVPLAQIHEAIAAYTPSNNRSQVEVRGTNTIIFDAYNANPSSVEAALESFDMMETARQKVVILGDMLELGADSHTEHQAIVDMVMRMHFDRRYFCGERFAACQNPYAQFFQTREALMAHLAAEPVKQSYILLKASRGMQLEKVAAVF